MRPKTPSIPAVKFEHVSKRFTLRHERTRSFQEVMVNLFQRNGGREEFWALKDVNFTIAPGETVGMIGENGSGKSTSLKLISGVLQPNKGKISVNGRVSALLELGAGFHPDLTGKDNIFLNASLLGFSRREMLAKLDDIIEFSELGRFIDVPIKHYSSGMSMRLGFAIAINVDFDILITDEILAVGDRAFQEKCYAQIRRFKELGKTIVIVSHDLEAIQDMCTRVLLLHQGRLVGNGDSSTVIPLYLELLGGREGALFPLLGVTREPSPVGKEADHLPSPAVEAPPRAVKLTGVEILNGQGQVCQQFHSGSEMIVCFSYRALKPNAQPSFSLAIHRADGSFIYGNTSGPVKEEEVVARGGKRELNCVLELPLLEGRYLLSAAVYDGASQELYDRWAQPCEFEVLGDYSSLQMEGLVRIPCRWESSKPRSGSWLGKVLGTLNRKE